MASAAEAEASPASPRRPARGGGADVAKLVELGFPEQDAREALRRCGSVDEAVIFLANQATESAGGEASPHRADDGAGARPGKPRLFGAWEELELAREEKRRKEAAKRDREARPKGSARQGLGTSKADMVRILEGFGFDE